MQPEDAQRAPGLVHHRQHRNLRRAPLHQLQGCPQRGSGAGSPALPPEGGTPNLLTAFSAALDDDLNISAAWGEVFKWVSEMNRRLAQNSLNAKDTVSALAAWDRI